VAAADRGRAVSTEDTITREELAAAISAIVGAQSFVCIGDAQEAASTIFAAAERIAEPEYEPGEIYQDPSGRAWFRLRLDGGWRCCESGTSYTGDVPERPLLKMGPEPPRASPPAAPRGNAVVIPGEMYEDAGGRRFYAGQPLTGWVVLPEGIPGVEPRYPLRKLVPEGSQARAPVSRSEVIDTLGTFGMHEPARSGKIADYIMSLLRGEQP
jgi:hypothetical protein